MNDESKKNKTIKEVSILQFTGFIFAIVFEFLGFLLLFGISGYYIQNYFFKDNFIVLTLFIFLGFIISLYFMYKRVIFLSSMKISKLRDKSFRNYFINKEKETQKRIENAKTEMKEYEKKMDELLKKYEKK